MTNLTPAGARLSGAAFALLAACTAVPALAADDDSDQNHATITVTGRRQTIDNAPSTTVSIDAATIDATVNAANVEDTLKYLPSLVVRKRHIGDTQAPLATRTSGLGASARTLVYADGMLLSALVGNNNTSASPRWGLVAPEEIERIDVLYGPFSAAYAGNSIGAVVNITTRTPDHLEARVKALTSVQSFDQYGTRATYPSRQLSASVGDRVGPLALFLSATETISNGQPISFVTASPASKRAADAVPVTGGVDALSRTGARVRVLGASGIEHQRQDMLKLKAALDISPSLRLTYVGGLFLDDTSASAETYLSGTLGAFYAGNITVAGSPYAIAPSAFSNGVYTRDARHWAQALSAAGASGTFDWQLIATRYDFDKDVQRTPTAALPAAAAGGLGQLVRLDGTGWSTLDAKASWRGKGQLVSFGAHWEQVDFASHRYTAADWRSGLAGALNLASRGKTATTALWAQDDATLAEGLRLTLGGRYEWWRAFDASNYSASPPLDVDQPRRHAHGFSPKAGLEWQAAPDLTLRASAGRAIRFPTVGELYQAITTGPTLTVPDPTLRPERATSEELAAEWRTAKGLLRLSLFNEIVEDALVSQSAPLVAGSSTLYSYVQNVERTRARGAELAVEQRDLLPRLDLSASLTYADSATAEDRAFPAAVGKLLPSVPRWKASAVVTWRPTDRASLTAATRYASRNWGTLDHSDGVGNTWQGFYRYFVVDARARFDVTQRYSFAFGVDNLTNDRYFLYHPFPQRSFLAEVELRL